jgi:hypothetical protein
MPGHDAIIMIRDRTGLPGQSDRQARINQCDRQQAVMGVCISGSDAELETVRQPVLP